MNAVSRRPSSGLIDQNGDRIAPQTIEAVRHRASLAGRNPSPFPYDAAAVYGQETDGWFPYLQSPDTEINYTADLVRARNRDLIRNDGWASGSIGRLADGLVGSNFYVVPSPNWRALARMSGLNFDAAWAAEFRSAAMSEWRIWANDPLFFNDAARVMTVDQQMYVAMRHKLADGDALAQMQWNEDDVGYGAARYSTQIQLLDPDRLSNPYERMDTHSTRGGVEIDNNGAPVGYHIRRAHQNDWYDAGLSMIWDYFPRYTPWGRPIIVHDCERDRASQHRGQGIFTPVLNRFKVLAKYDQVALQAAIMRTVLGFFVKSPYDAEQVQMAMEAGESQEKLFLSGYQRARFSLGDEHGVQLGGVRLPVLAPGEDITSAKVGNEAEDFDVFEHTVLRSIAAATGESASELTKDYSKVNYSSERAAMLSAWKTLLRRRADFTKGFGMPIYSAFLEEAIERGYLPMPNGAPDFIAMRSAYSQAEFIGPGRGWVDPLKERQGEVLGLDAGFGTLHRTCADIGGVYWEDTLDQRQIEEAAMKARGLSLPDWAGGEIATKVEKPE
jgi:lambda family phage portal protein